MIKLTRKELITALRNQVSVMAKEIDSEGSIYWCHDLIEKMDKKIMVIKRLYAHNPSTDFEVVPIEYSKDDINPESIETCELGIPEPHEIRRELSLKCMEHPADDMVIESSEYLKSVIKEHTDDARKRELEIERLNEVIVDLERQYEKSIASFRLQHMEDIEGWKKEVDKLNKIISKLDVEGEYSILKSNSEQKLKEMNFSENEIINAASDYIKLLFWQKIPTAEALVKAAKEYPNVHISTIRWGNDQMSILAMMKTDNK